MRPVFLVLAAFACIHSSLAITEHLLFHELAYGVVSVTAAFAAHQTGGAHEPTFPRSVTSLLDSFPVKELNLTLTRGHWREEWYASTQINVMECIHVCGELRFAAFAIH